MRSASDLSARPRKHSTVTRPAAASGKDLAAKKMLQGPRTHYAVHLLGNYSLHPLGDHSG